MESSKEAVTEKGKRLKSRTRYPKKLPTYVVAFAVQETLDDPHKLDQVTNERSTDSTSSIKSMSTTDSNSTKTFTISNEKLSTAHNIATLSEVKINVEDENQFRDLTETKAAEFSNYTVIDKRTVDKVPEIIFNTSDKITADQEPEVLFNTSDKRTANQEPEIIFNTSKHNKRRKNNNKFPRKNPIKSKCVIKFSNTTFKKPKHCISRTLEKYYEKVKLNTPNAEQIQKQIYCNDLSKFVSRSQVLKENSQANSEQISTHDDFYFDYDDESLKSTSSSAKKSFISHSSQKTLVYKGSPSSRNDDECSSTKTANSVIRVALDEQVPYSELFNVSLLINDSKTYANQTGSSSIENLLHKENLTSSETFLQNHSTELTSKPSSSEEHKTFKIDYNDFSPINLIEKIKNNDTVAQAVKLAVERHSDDDTFGKARTSSDFNKSSIISNLTLQINSETTVLSENVQSSLPTNHEFSKDISNKNTALLHRIETLGFYPMDAPIASDANIDCKSNDVLVTDSINDTFLFTRDTKNIDDNPTDAKKTSVLRKLVEVKNMSYFQNNICLPDDVAIKAKLNEKGEEKQSCAFESGGQYPKDMGEICDRLALLIDLAVKRLEQTLTYRIVNDIRESLALYNQPAYKAPMAETARVTTTAAPVNNERPIPTIDKAIFVKEEHLKLDVDVYVQCDLVQKQVIDQLMLQLSLVPKPIPASGEAIEILKPTKLLRDYTEVLKPPAAHVTDSVSVEDGKVGTVTVSTATTELSTIRSFRRFKQMISCPMAVLRENMVIMTSVPTFFIVLFCLYGVIVIVMKPW